MKTVCCSCGTVLEDGTAGISHGICIGCFREALDYAGLDCEDLVDVDQDAELGGEG